MRMNISPQLKETAVENFESEFGEIVRGFSHDTDDYEYFVDEFLHGVQFGLTHTNTNQNTLLKESVERYGELSDSTEPMGEKVFECSSYVFLYGAEWGTDRATVRLPLQ